MSSVNSFGRRSWMKGRLRFEPLENRLMLSGGPGDNGLPDGSDPGRILARFGSAEELEQYLIQDALERYQAQFGQPGYWWYWRGGPYLDGAVTTFGGVPEANPTHSDTNTQVAGVDEDDIVETDGEYLYVLSGQEVVIIDAWPADEMSVASLSSPDSFNSPAASKLENSGSTSSSTCPSMRARYCSLATIPRRRSRRSRCMTFPTGRRRN